MVHGDFNGDGTTDVAMANFYFSSTDTTHGSVSVLLGNGDGTYKGAVSYDSGGWGALSLTVGDFNGDGKLDLAVANRCNNSSDCTHSSVSVLLGNGDGTYKSAVSYFSGGQGAYASVTVGDFNGDGILDLAVANACISTI